MQDSVQDLFAMHWYLAWRFDAETNLVASNFNHRNHDIVVDEFLRVLGCETSDGTKESANSAAKRWSSALERMAIRMTTNNPFGDAHSGYMAIDAVRHAPHTCLHRAFQSPIRS